MPMQSSSAAFTELKVGASQASSGPGGMWDYEAAVERRQTDGGTSRAGVKKQIDELRKWLA